MCTTSYFLMADSERFTLSFTELHIFYAFGCYHISSTLQHERISYKLRLQIQKLITTEKNSGRMTDCSWLQLRKPARTAAVDRF